jgi:predicted MFS family arabinose efflux permease
MIPLGYFGQSDFSSLNLMTFLLYGAFGSALLLLPYVLITAGGYSPVEAGLAMLPFPIIISFASPLMGKFASRIGPRWPLTIGPLVVAAGLLLATRVASGQDYWIDVLPGVGLMAVGMALAVAPLTSAVLVTVDPEHTGMVSGFNSALSRTGGLIGVALLGAVLASSGRAILRPYEVALIIAAAVAALSGIVAFLGLKTCPNPKARAAAPA